jgi:hypothetical protein
MQIGSPCSKRTGWCGRASFQFMVKVEGCQSVSTAPAGG